REQGGVELEVRVLRRRTDQRHETLLDAGKQRILLRLVEAVDLVEEEDGAPAARPQPLTRTRENLADLRDGRGDRRQLFELRARRVGDDAGERRLARTRRAEEDERRHAVGVDRTSQRASGCQDVLLADELVERLRSQPLCER